MTHEQYDRWKDFAVRMARTCFRGHREPDSRWIVEVVEDFFDGLDKHDVPCIVSWDNSAEYPEGSPYRRHEPYGHHWAKPHGVGDMMTEFLDDYRGHAPACDPCREYENDEPCRCEDIEDNYYEQWDDRWGGPVHCCIRAGLDCASAPSAGVLGFTAGDLRMMYPEGVPDWVFPPDEQLRYWLTDTMNGTFAELPDDAGVVL